MRYLYERTVFVDNVFDTIPFVERKTSLSQISQLQSSGDRLLIMLDTNPCLDVTIEQLETLHPEHTVLPYFPLTNECSKFSVIVVPSKFVNFKPSEKVLTEMVEKDTMAIMCGYMPERQYELHQLQKKFNLKVIELEDFFAEQMKSELEQAGYRANVYYHASFVVEDVPKGISAVNQDLIYKSVTDTATIRQWSLTDRNLLNWLAKKGLKLPGHFNGAFLSNIKEKGQKISGAEVLVIEATKT